jgi:hypothetical protein
MNTNKYTVATPYPRLDDFTTIYFYRNGRTVAVREPDGNYYTVSETGVKTWVDAAKVSSAAAERVVDTTAYQAARKKWQDEEAACFQAFKDDLLRELEIVSNPKADLLFQKAWERGHADGYENVYAIACDLVDLIK